MARLSFLSFLLMTTLALGRDATGQYTDSKFAAWYAAQYNKGSANIEQSGNWCCNEADGYRYDGAYTMNPDGTVTLNGTTDIQIAAYKVLDGTTVTGPDGKLRGGPNPTGHAIVWLYPGPTPNPDGSNIICFDPGPLE